MKKLPRNPMRLEEEPGADKEIWQPGWKCFCCHDTGIVNPHLAALAIEGYDFNRDRLPRCQKTGCFAGSHYDSTTLAPSVDYRLTPAICQELDLLERENWRDYVEQQRRISIDLSDVVFNLRARSRTSDEALMAQRKHEEARAR